MDYISAPEAALKWGISERRVQKLCEDSLCRKCVHGCKQRFRAVVVECPRYLSKRAK